MKMFKYLVHQISEYTLLLQYLIINKYVVSIFIFQCYKVLYTTIAITFL